MKEIQLNNGVYMPQQGLGTFLIPKDQLSRTIAEAYELGYRQFDTAWRYHNEQDIAKALKENGINRNDVFITSKFNADSTHLFGYWWGKHSIINFKYRSIKSAIKESFDNLATDYIDLYLIHWPYPFYKDLWQEMERLYKEGRIRAIGVCSFLPPHLEALKSVTELVPAVNQFEISPLNTQKQLIDYCRKQGGVLQ